MKQQRAAAIQHVLDDVVARGLAPGVVASVVHADGACERFMSGHRLPPDESDQHDAVTADTIYDLASLTKLLCTTTLLARAVDDDVIALDEEAHPRWPRVTVAHLLQHTAGLAAHRPLHELAIREQAVALRRGKDVVVEAALASGLDAPPGARTLYSDLGFIALGALLEERTGEALDVLFAAQARSLNATGGLRFVRLADDGYHPGIPDVAPSERCPWRRRAVQGQVHDENAFAMGGVAGHAGLFGSLVDVEGAGLALLRDVAGDTTLARFARAPGERGLGFDKATPTGSTAGVLGPRAVGHLGFTGTSLWLDPDLRLAHLEGRDHVKGVEQRGAGTAFVLLANTAFPTRGGVLARNKAMRRAFHRAAVLGEATDVVVG